MGFNITEIVESKGWKKFMAKLYGWGAAVVIVGALFKIMHWPGAGPMLVVGLSTEAVIFFFSAFEPLHEEIDWSLVYPELAGMHDDVLEEHHDDANKKDHHKSALEKFDELINGAEITPNLFEKLGKGLNNLSETTSKISDISNASVATQDYITNIKSASTSFNNLSDSYNKSVQDLNQSAGHLSSTYAKTAEIVANTNNELASKITTAGDGLFQTYKKITDSLQSGSSSIVDTNKNYADQLEFLTKNLSALNAVYELQLQGTNEQMKASEQLYSGIHEVLTNLKDSVDDTKKYREEVSKLSNNLAALNTIYGNMLTAMNFNQRPA